MNANKAMSNGRNAKNAGGKEVWGGLAASRREAWCDAEDAVDGWNDGDDDEGETDDELCASSGYRALPEDIALTRRARALGVLDTPSGYLFYEGFLLTGTVNGQTCQPVHLQEARNVVHTLIGRCEFETLSGDQ